MKAGTTSLHMYLAEHPEIEMSRVKEPHFFAREEDGPYPSRIGARPEYERLFDSTVDVRGESSPTYSLYPRHQEVPQRIHELVPDAKFVYLVRDPIDRIVSHYLHNVAVDGLRASFADHVGDLSDPRNPYVYPSLYAMQLERYLEVFPAEAILVVDQSELATRRRQSLEEIFVFLGVDPDFDSEGFRETHGTASERRQLAKGYEQFRDRLGRAPVHWIPQRIRRSARGRVERFLWPPLPTAAVPERAREQLHEVCAPDIERLRSYSGRALDTWKT